jgi:hypothetical protein
MKFELDQNDTETLQKLKDKALMLKVICLDEMGKSPMVNVSNMVKRDKVKLKVEIEKKWDVMPDADILKLFNEICTETIFDENGMDVEKMPVIAPSNPELPEAEVERISALPPQEQLKICGRILRAESAELSNEVLSV